LILKKIELYGFKSFADKLEFKLDQNITCIVGPNGSGKSNVVDAVRWVLGEQSVKSLRGDGNMTDVIFSGSKSRNPMNVASVTLVFDNTDKYLPLEYDEVEIKRRVYKDGTNEYFLNNERVRLKDITNLLLDSGIAKESFNIISQGKIESIISSKPNERRVIFEEAAGVLKYKRRKEEAIRKLDKTHNNLSRVNDIINELEPQIEPLKEAKEKAEKLIKQLDKVKDDKKLESKFAELAKENSDDTATYSDGGTLKDITKKDVVEEFWKAASKLKNGKYTDKPVKTTYGYHVILRVSSTDVEKYDDIKDDVKIAYAENMLNNDTTVQTIKWDELRKKYKLSIKDDTIKEEYEDTIKEAKETSEKSENENNEK